MAIPTHNAPNIDPLAFGADPGQVAVGGQFGMGSGCGGTGAGRTPAGAAGIGGVPETGPTGSGGTDDPAVDLGAPGETDSGGTAQMGSPSWRGARRVPQEVQEVRPGSLSVPHQAQRLFSTHPPRCSKDRGVGSTRPGTCPAVSGYRPR